jgi:hypothetical protein
VTLLISIVLGINIDYTRPQNEYYSIFKESYLKIIWQLSFDLNLKENNPSNPSI